MSNWTISMNNKILGTTGSWFHYLIFYINWHGSFVHCCRLTLPCYLIWLFNQHSAQLLKIHRKQIKGSGWSIIRGSWNFLLAKSKCQIKRYNMVASCKMKLMLLLTQFWQVPTTVACEQAVCGRTALRARGGRQVAHNLQQKRPV